MSDAAFRCGDGAQKSRVVVVVDPEPKPGAQVLDFGTVEKAGAARDLVGNVRLAQGFLERLGLVVGAVQHGKVPQFLKLRPTGADAAGAQALDARHGAFGFVVFAVGIDHAHRLAFAQVAPQVLREQLGVGADHVVGGAQDGAGGAVVLFQLDDLERGEVQRQAFEVVQRGAAPAVDRLVIVAHRRKTRLSGRLAADQQLEHFVLRGVGVLVFIDQHMADQALPFLAHGFMVLQQFERQADQVVEINALVGRKPFLVVRHDARDDAFVVILRRSSGAFGVVPEVLPQADGPLPTARRGGIDRAAGVFEDAVDVVAVEDRELRLEAERGAVLAQHAHTQRVEGADQHVFGRSPDQVLGAFAHFAGGLVGEGDGGNALGLQPGLDQACDLVRDDARLARSRASKHQTGAVHVIDGFLLGQVQASCCIR